MWPKKKGRLSMAREQKLHLVRYYYVYALQLEKGSKFYTTPKI